MSYQVVFLDFWSEVEKSIESRTFAKLTMAKTIGKQALRNIFVRPVLFNNEYKYLIKWHYRPKDKTDEQQLMGLNNVFEIVKFNLKNPFYSVVLFTIEKDLMFKINKKGAGSIIENPPTFSTVVFANDDID